MGWREKTRFLLYALLTLLAATAAGIYVFEPEVASNYYLYEFLGALLATSIIFFGLLRMHGLTS